MLHCSGGYSRSVAKNQFWHLDTDATTVTTDAGTNPGITARGAVAHGGNRVQTLVPLNRYFFLEELADRLLPPMQLESEILLQDDRMIFQNDRTARRIIVGKFELWSPMLPFTAEGQTLVNENFFKPSQWTYQKETLYLSSSKRDASGQESQTCVCFLSTNTKAKRPGQKSLHL